MTCLSKWLKEDIVGAASRITYGLKGDQVAIIREELEMCLVELNNQRFFVRYEKLSEEKVDPTPKAIRESSKSVQRTRQRKR